MREYLIDENIIRDFCHDAITGGRVPTNEEINLVIGNYEESVYNWHDLCEDAEDLPEDDERLVYAATLIKPDTMLVEEWEECLEVRDTYHCTKHMYECVLSNGGRVIAQMETFDEMEGIFVSLEDECVAVRAWRYLSPFRPKKGASR